jgi:hypothetical protein
VREFRGAPSIVVSGQQRQSLLTRALMDWAGPRGFLRKMDCRHRTSTYEGDMHIFSAKVIEKSSDPESPWIVCEFDGRNQKGEQILRGTCTILLPWASASPTSDSARAAPVWNCTSRRPRARLPTRVYRRRRSIA